MLLLAFHSYVVELRGQRKGSSNYMDILGTWKIHKLTHCSLFVTWQSLYVLLGLGTCCKEDAKKCSCSFYSWSNVSKAQSTSKGMELIWLIRHHSFMNIQYVYFSQYPFFPLFKGNFGIWESCGDIAPLWGRDCTARLAFLSSNSPRTGAVVN